MRLHHVQVACPPGGEDVARRFYADGLGMTEVDKPVDLVARGGCWFRAYDGAGAVAAELHVGVEDPFAPARKAHPAFVVPDQDDLDVDVLLGGGLGVGVVGLDVGGPEAAVLGRHVSSSFALVAGRPGGQVPNRNSTPRPNR